MEMLKIGGMTLEFCLQQMIVIFGGFIPIFTIKTQILAESYKLLAFLIQNY